jgi:hypothetical protein
MFKVGDLVEGREEDKAYLGVLGLHHEKVYRVTNVFLAGTPNEYIEIICNCGISIPIFSDYFNLASLPKDVKVNDYV